MRKITYIKLSYDLGPTTPYPAGLWPVEIRNVHNIGNGDISNVFDVKLCNHVGTHIDGPMHFNMMKKPLSAFGIQKFIYNKTAVVDLPKYDAELITAEELIPYKNVIEKCDLLLMRTGFSKIRKEDPKRYQECSPGFSVSAARYIVEETSLSALGMDTLSFASPQQLDEGIKAHQILMSIPNRDVFLIEDINLDFDLTHLKQVMAIPLFFEGLDSAPCTVIAKV